MRVKRGVYPAPFHSFEDRLPQEVLDMVREQEYRILSGEFVFPIDESKPQPD